MTTLQRLFAGNCYFAVHSLANPPVHYSFRLSLDPSGLPPMGREIKLNNDDAFAYHNCQLYNIFVKNQATGRYNRIGDLQIVNKIPHFTWWRSLEWVRAKVMLRAAIHGNLPVTFARRCCRCGKIISVENSKKGYGPECEKYLKGGDNN